ncbi:hypothetical protein [Carboxylicivirga sp. N1Y90]|uniref:hypothetical protein n=1 Tax=Carboxylicivirga fragile TaxID=3417571 RepID=UPI003D34EBBD|nr:hypothetical protein [Marinilabiliaceae bacterium N1Y90]
MKRSIFLLAIALCLSSLSMAVTPVVKQNQVQQHKRIVNGITSGELTRYEVRQLEAQQHNINKTKRIAKADGVVTKKERSIIYAKQKKANRNIYFKKHNNRNRK